MVTLAVSDDQHSSVPARRRERYRLLEWLRSRSTRAGAARCMHGLGASVTLAGTSAGVTHVGGVGRCSSPWACPVCAPTIGERRAGELDELFDRWLRIGGEVWFVTATVQHSHGDDLAGLLAMLQGAWTRTFRWGSGVSPVWYGGQARTIEVTYGSNGWHPHIHAAVFIEPGWTGDRAAIERELVDMRHQWEESVNLYGGFTDVRRRRSPGWDVRPVRGTAGLSSYLTKVEGGWGAGLELARLDLKRGKGATPLDLLASAFGGDRRAAWLFRGYELATAGKKRIVVSRRLAARLGVELVTDEEASDVELDAPAAAVVSVPADDWRRLLAAGHACSLIESVGELGRTGDLGGWAWPRSWVVDLRATAPPPLSG